MSSQVTTARALTVFVASKALKLISIIALVVAIVLFVGIWLLAINFSQWWWLLLIPLAILIIVFLALRLVLQKLFARIYRHPFSREQRAALEGFTGKLTRLIEARSTPLPIYALMTLWDVIRRRDATTIRALIADSTSLKKDFNQLKSLFEKKVS